MLNSKMVKVTLRDIAKMLVKAMPIDGQEFGDKVEAYIAILKKLKPEAKTALAAAYVFSSKVNKQDREDMFSDIVLAVLKANVKDEALAYSIARCDWMDFWRKQYHKPQVDSLDNIVIDNDGNEISASELIAGEVEFEAKEVDKLEASQIYNSLPFGVKVIVNKRLAGKAVTGAERLAMFRFTKTAKAKLILATIQS